ncbi:MAG: hypothetical protein Ta2C_06280 [Candidatus Endomicrobiellum trichonymphae]|nr:MAG: hypothetical protein Ta2C_06280 [Candidatus Endomicrobium trichonymphae]
MKNEKINCRSNVSTDGWQGRPSLMDVRHHSLDRQKRWVLQDSQGEINDDELVQHSLSIIGTFKNSRLALPLIIWHTNFRDG